MIKEKQYSLELKNKNDKNRLQGSATNMMNKEQLIEKKVKHGFNGKETLFSVDSLNKHFEGLVIHESDILTDEFEDQDEGYIRAEDVDFSDSTINDIDSETDFTIEIGETVLEEGHFIAYETLKESGYEIGDTLVYEEEKPWYKKEDNSNPDGMSFEEAEVILNEGDLISLPEWEGFWFKNLVNGQLLVFTKDNEILDTPHDEYKLRTDWIKVDATPEQELVLDNYFNPKKTASIVVNDPIVETGKSLVEKLIPIEEEKNIQELKEQQITESLKVEDLKTEEVSKEVKLSKQSNKK